LLGDLSGDEHKCPAALILGRRGDEVQHLFLRNYQHSWEPAAATREKPGTGHLEDNLRGISLWMIRWKMVAIASSLGCRLEWLMRLAVQRAGTVSNDVANLESRPQRHVGAREPSGTQSAAFAGESEIRLTTSNPDLECCEPTCFVSVGGLSVFGQR